MSLFQTLCLLLFNEGNEFTLEEIRNATAIGIYCHLSIISHINCTVACCLINVVYLTACAFIRP